MVHPQVWATLNLVEQEGYLFRYEVFELLMGARLNLKFNSLYELSNQFFYSIKRPINIR